ncbi:Fur family transcriptional regulator [Mediannikoviicoccus vaginalis]|uniref:Fur family transcriptional regulator n=1 Tax=Mediannikoviicoccus vaginalis TaxID=2899727 RepID=UPI001F2B4D0A|nr:Fur family transcriptional regulator [Mediannikoviicoccus vaginalis]
MDLDKFKSILQNNGYKITKQREVIFETLLENSSEHLSPEELHLIVNKKDKDIGIATVYRTLQLFEELNLVYKLNFDDNRYRYELTRDEEHQHHHLICTQCNKVEEVSYDLTSDIEESIRKNYGFKVTNYVLKFFGICSQCQEKNSK